MMTLLRSTLGRCAIVTAVLTATLIFAPPARGQDSLQGTSLNLVPADAAWYTTSLGLGEQWDALAQSRAYERLLSHPWVALGIARLRAEWENPDNEELTPLREWLEQPDNAELVELAKQSLREELFLFGDRSVADLLLVLNRVNRAQQMAAFQAGLTGQDAEQAQLQAVVSTLEENRDQLVIPVVMIGARVPDADAARRQIARVEPSLRGALADYPEFTERLGRETVAGRELVVWRLDTELLPWEQWIEGTPEDRRERVEKIRDILREKTLVAAIGVWDDYLVLSLGPDTSHLETLGAEPLLANSEWFAPLSQAADERIASVSYVSNDLLAALNVANVEQIDDVARFAEQFIETGGPLVQLPDDLQVELKADIRKLAATIKESIPTTGAILSYTFLVPEGYESFTYNWGEQRGVDPTRPLPIVQHLGGSPILAVATRHLYQPEQYAAFARGMRRVGYYLDRIANVYLSGETLAWYERFREEGTPLIDRINKTTSDLLLPSLADGQFAFVLDAAAAAPSWHAMMPPAAEPLPLPAIGFVCGVSDAEMLKRAGTEYLAIAEDAFARLRAAVEDASESGDLPEEAAEQFPDIDIQPPQSRDLENANLYWYSFPAHWGLNEKLAISAALSEDFVAFAVLPELAERLIAEHPVDAFGLLEDGDRPLATAVVFDFTVLVDAARPWVAYIAALSQNVQPTEADQNEVVRTLNEQVQALLDIAACFRGVAAVTYRQGNVFITHSRTRFRDLPAE